jgi:hypothetical protein
LEEPFRPVKNFFKEERFFDCSLKDNTALQFRCQ